jgi:hypothetical protein
MHIVLDLASVKELKGKVRMLFHQRYMYVLRKDFSSNKQKKDAYRKFNYSKAPKKEKGLIKMSCKASC